METWQYTSFKLWFTSEDLEAEIPMPLTVTFENSKRTGIPESQNPGNSRMLRNLKMQKSSLRTSNLD